MRKKCKTLVIINYIRVTQIDGEMAWASLIWISHHNFNEIEN